MEDQAPTLKIIDDTPTEVVNESVVPEHVHVPERLEGETFEAYKLRRMFSQSIKKSNRRGNLIWNSRPEIGKKGVTYVKPKEL